MTDEWLAGLRWTAAPRHTQWGAGMMEALVPLGNDHTLRLYVEAGALHLVGPALSGTNRDAPADEAADAIERLARALRLVMSCAGDIDAASDASLESALECDDEATRKQANAWLVARQALRGPNAAVSGPNRRNGPPQTNE